METAGDIHTINIPTASASNRGALSSSDWSTFNSKRSNSLASTQVWIGNVSGGAEAQSLGGDIASITNAGVVTLKNTGTVGTYFKVVTDAQGRVSSGGSLASGDIVSALGYTPASAGSGITSINGSTVSSQSFAVPGTTGAAPAWVVNTGTGLHTLNIPMASTTSVTAGLISKADYDIFNNKLSATVTTPTSGQYLTYNGSAWVNSLLSVNLGTQVTGTLPVSNGGTGVTSLSAGTLVVGNGTGAVSGLAGGTAGNIIYASGATTWASTSPDSAGLVDKSTAQTVAGAKTFSSVITSSVTSGTNAFDASNGNIKAGPGGSSTIGGGQIYTGAFIQSGPVIDFNKGNLQSTTYDCASGNITLNNMHSGGNYTLVVTSTTTNPCNLYDGGTIIAAAQFSPSNSVRTAGLSTVYNLTKLGSTVYVTWRSVGGGWSDPSKLPLTGGTMSGVLSSTSQIVPGYANMGASLTLNFNSGNTMTTSYDCASTIQLGNMVDGGNYTVIVTGTGTTQCNFNDPSVSFWKFMPANGPRTASSHTVYSLLKAGTTVYVWWTPGF